MLGSILMLFALIVGTAVVGPNLPQIIAALKGE